MNYWLLPDSAKLIISEVSAWTSLLYGAWPSKLGISTRPSSRTFPACNLLSAVTIAAFGMGCVMFGLSRICSRFSMCLFTASKKSMFIRSDWSGALWPHDAHVSWAELWVSAPVTELQRAYRTHATKQDTARLCMLMIPLKGYSPNSTRIVMFHSATGV